MLILASNIIVTKNQDKAVNKVLETIKFTNTQNNPDLKIIELELKKTKIPIEEIRKAISWVNIKPYSGNKKVLIIKDGEKLSIESQNALLKTLEEPPSYLYSFIITPSSSLLLDTTRSRCNAIKILEEESKTEPNFDLTLEQIFQKDLAYVLDKTENLLTSDDSRKNTVNFIKSLQIELSQNTAKFPVSTFKKLNETLNDLLSTNVSTKMALYKLILDLKQTQT